MSKNLEKGKDNEENSEKIKLSKEAYKLTVQILNLLIL
jgi:hypothetical protein